MKLGAVGVLIAGLAVLVIVRSTGAADGRPLSGAELYARLAEQAAEGDAEAAEYKQQLDEYLASSAMRAFDLNLPAANVRMTSRGEVDLRVTDSAPWGISITNDVPDRFPGQRLSNRRLLLTNVVCLYMPKRRDITALDGERARVRQFTEEFR